MSDALDDFCSTCHSHRSDCGPLSPEGVCSVCAHDALPDRRQPIPIVKPTTNYAGSWSPSHHCLINNQGTNVY